MNIARLAAENVSKFGLYDQLKTAIKKRGNSGSCPSSCYLN